MNGYADELTCRYGHVYDTYETFTCNNPGTSSASCTSSSVDRRRTTCSDGCEDGECSDPVPEPECNLDSDCGISRWRNDLRCMLGNVFDDYLSYSCLNPGTSEAMCDFHSFERLRTTCSDGCEDGECLTSVTSECSLNSDCGTNGYIDEPVCRYGNVYDTYETFTCYYPRTSRATCSSSTSQRIRTTCSDGCEDGECSDLILEPECNLNSDCGTDSWLDRLTCERGNVHDTYRTFICNNPGTLESSCSTSSRRTTRINCDSGCEDGECLDNSIRTQQDLPDLKVQSVILLNPEEVMEGQPAVYEFVIKNIGLIKARDISWVVRNEASEPFYFTDSGRYPIDELKPGHEMIVYPKFIQPCEDIIFEVDQDDLIEEMLESNNFLRVLKADELCPQNGKKRITAGGNRLSVITKIFPEINNHNILIKNSLIKQNSIKTVKQK